MKSKLRKSDYIRIYRMLDKVYPLDFDCGALCGSACCLADGEDYVMYLLPGEEKMFSGKEDWFIHGRDRAEEYEFPDSWSGYVHYIRCKDAPRCRREMRPIQCRTYPLAPYIDGNGVFTMIVNDDELPYTCPLVSGEMELNEDFKSVTFEAWKQLLCDPLIYDLVEADSRARDQRFLSSRR